MVLNLKTPLPPRQCSDCTCSLPVPVAKASVLSNEWPSRTQALLGGDFALTQCCGWQASAQVTILPI